MGAKGLSRTTYKPLSWTHVQSDTFVSSLPPHLPNKDYLSQAVMIIQSAQLLHLAERNMEDNAEVKAMHQRGNKVSWCAYL